MHNLTDHIQTFSEINFREICDQLAKTDLDLQVIIANDGYPPFWSRPPGFETLVHIILEQQVSLASAKAAMDQLRIKLKYITPELFVTLTNDELKACYFSRQKITYTQQLANALINNELNLDTLTSMDNETARSTLTRIKGIGYWTADVYLMMALQRSNLFPLGDLALINSLKKTKNLPKNVSKSIITSIASAWYPFQTIAAFILWHAYLSKSKPAGFQ